MKNLLKVVKNKKINIISYTIISIIVIYNFDMVQALSYATEPTVQTELGTAITEEQQKAYQVALECIAQLKSKLKELDKKQQELREQKEYDKYPAVRLNVDTPLFGICSITDNKLKITKDVSTQDIAAGYSIKDVVNKSIVKVPDFRVANVVVSTRDIKISENMSTGDVNLVILKLLDYIDQVESTIEFLDNQTEKIFLDYIPEEKLQIKSALKEQLKQVYSELVQIDKNIQILKLTGYDSVELEKLVSDTNRYKSMYRNYSKQMNKILIDDELLEDFKGYIGNLESAVSSTNSNVGRIAVKQKSNVNVKEMLISVKQDLTTRKEDIDKYIANSINQKEISTEAQADATSSQNLEEVQTHENITVYEVCSQEVSEYMKEKLASIDEKLLKYAPEELNKEVPSEVLAKTEVVNKSTEEEKENTNTTSIVEEISATEKQNLSDEIYSIYAEYIKKENKFYTDNINLLLKDSTSKVTDINQYTEESTIDYTKYLYITLPTQLERELETNDTNFNVQTTTLIESVKVELTELLDVNLKLKQIYDIQMVADLKNRD